MFEGSLIMKDYKITQNIRTLDKEGKDKALNKKARRFEDMIYQNSQTQTKTKNMLFKKSKIKNKEKWKKYDSQKYVERESQKNSIKKMNSLDSDPYFLYFETINENDEDGINYDEVDFTPLSDLDFTTNVRRLSKTIENMNLKTSNVDTSETNTETSENGFI